MTMNTRSTKPNEVAASPAPSPPSYITLDDLKALFEHLNSTNVAKIDELHLSVDEMQSATPNKIMVASKFNLINNLITTLASKHAETNKHISQLSISTVKVIWCDHTGMNQVMRTVG